ncbi:peptidyl-prolyl cis-trans isomerase B (cyclophilin B) [Amycolatopsis xylanica]|uniref:Peptidyl-prolyl cis-trans isomerase n=1 Tax=Amycolatopsis xylanica TaxID=589385 RepID=A0A1H3MWA9_9PSEU|nr:peptidylprolyl isomerase [Amycolatopsis xylanica]SDY81007.1 peptidyl-prolyl cis-trans isomerase B (cyclophilin B) [Amycolatopsis xylanica]
MTYPPQPPPFPGQGGPPPRPKTPWLWITLGVVAVLVAGGTGIVLALHYLNGDSSGAVAGDRVTTSSSTSAPPTSAPVQIDGSRTPLPKRPTPLPDPTGCEYKATSDRPTSKPATKPADGNVPASGKATVTLRTGAGTIGLDLDRALAPCTVASFVSLAKQGFYTGTSCHRLSVEGLQMLQCGDPTGQGTGGPGYAFDDEVFPQLQYGRGILAMANAGPGTNGSQFFMVFGDAPLPPSYTVFGSISDEGLSVLDKVAKAGIDQSKPSPAQDGSGPPVMAVQFSEVTVG